MASIVQSCFFVNKGTHALLTTKDGCYLARLRDSWKCEHLFHQNDSPIHIVKQVPCENAIRILCIYSNFASLLEIKSTKNEFSTSILKNYYNYSHPIVCRTPLLLSFHCSGCLGRLLPHG